MLALDKDDPAKEDSVKAVRDSGQMPAWVQLISIQGWPVCSACVMHADLTRGVAGCCSRPA